MSNSKITPLQQKFIDLWDGDIKKTANKTGMSYDYARRLVTKNHKIKEAIRNREQTEIRPKNIATRQERQEFWSKVMNSRKENMTNRLRASELLGKSEADFTENILNVNKVETELIERMLIKLDELSIEDIRQIAYADDTRKKPIQASE